ncbi:DUF2889 domain-containing protein [Tomitella biformata]|uniref:DUF2889 domain-containing protein n=1 Tax=Tomitella biformata TaxID=630403 RepID=UPI000467E3B9|nr:DUF2889 domain-containing protein [Tomitella biformata]
MAENLLAPTPGIQEPAPDTPNRRPRSIRRTTSVDILRPAGPTGVLELVGSGRDLSTSADGVTEAVAEARMAVDIDFAPGQIVRRVDCTPMVTGLGALVGARASSGFRKALSGALGLDGSPAQGSRAGSNAISVLHRLLDDVPVATVISGFALTHELPAEDLARISRGGERQRRSGSPADYCAGFVSGGTMMRGVERAGVSPLIIGPPAPDVVNGADPEAWHSMSRMPVKSMRRLRRMDVWMDGPAPAGRVRVDAMFRDSYVDAGGDEMVVHEYQVDLELRADSKVLDRLVVTPRVLPWPECPGAVAGAQRLVGHTVAAAGELVGQEFRGVSSCTHLNDLLRSLGDVTILSEFLLRGR